MRIAPAITITMLALHATIAFAGKGGTPPTGYKSKPSVVTKHRLNQKSLLTKNGPQPSPMVTQIIRERESSGLGWLGGAFLVALLSRNDLSSSDRNWIQNQIDTLEEPLLPPVRPKVILVFTGLDGPLRVGEAADISVSAVDGSGKSLFVACDLPANADNQGRIKLSWTPDSPGVRLFTCKAGGHQERRVARVIAQELR